jgi:hypothetical protein
VQDLHFRTANRKLFNPTFLIPDIAFTFSLWQKPIGEKKELGRSVWNMQRAVETGLFFMERVLSDAKSYGKSFRVQTRNSGEICMNEKSFNIIS